MNFAGMIVFDLLLCNGEDAYNRFVEFAFENGIDYNSTTIIKADDSILEASRKYYTANWSLIANDDYVLLESQRRAILD